MSVFSGFRMWAMLLAGLIGIATVSAEPIDYAFTYQGKLMDAGQPANGTYDLAFSLYDDPTQNNGVGVGDVHEDIVVNDGLFTVDVELSGGEMVFNGQRRWLEVMVRPGASSGPYTPLSPRQRLTAVPNASFAIAAESLVLPMDVTQSNYPDPLITITNPTGPTLWVQSGNAAAFAAINNGDSPTIFAANAGNGPIATFLGNGNVGIGTQTPQEKLSVNGVIESKSGGVKFPDGTTQDSASPWTSAVGAGAYLFTGNAGIGTSAPTAALHLNQPLASTAIRFETTRSNQGPPAVAAQVPSAVAVTSPGWVSWVNPQNALGSDDLRASAALTESDGGLDFDTSMTLEFSGFNFAIPATATVSEVRIVFEGYADDSDSYAIGGGFVYPEVTVLAQLAGGAAAQSTPFYNAGYDYDVTAGGNVLAAGLTADSVNSPDFGVRLSFQLNMIFSYFWNGYQHHDVIDEDGYATILIDHVRVEILYYDASVTLTPANFTIGIPAGRGEFVLSPGPEPVVPSESLLLDGGVVIEPTRGNVGIGRVPTGAFGYKLDVDGEIRCSNLIETSSRRYKRNVRPLEHALDTVTRLRGVTFEWDEAHGGTPDIGFIAEEVGEVVPQIVRYEPDGVNASGMKYDHVTALTVEAIKELQATIQKQQAQIDELQTALSRQAPR